MSDAQQMVLLLIAASLIGIALLVLFVPVLPAYLRARSARAGVSLSDLIGMRLRQADARVIIDGRVRALQAGLDISLNALESHFHAGGRVADVVTAMIQARNAKVDLSWHVATTIDLAGQDVLQVVAAATSQSPPQRDGSRIKVRPVS